MLVRLPGGQMLTTASTPHESVTHRQSGLVQWEGVLFTLARSTAYESIDGMVVFWGPLPVHNVYCTTKLLRTVQYSTVRTRMCWRSVQRTNLRAIQRPKLASPALRTVSCTVRQLVLVRSQKPGKTAGISVTQIWDLLRKVVNGARGSKVYCTVMSLYDSTV